MENHKYSLQPYAGIATRYRCPQCGVNKVFARYIDNETGEQLADHVGRCNRDDKCAYHYTPKEYFADNNITFENKTDTVKGYKQTPKPQQKPEREPSFIDTKYFKQSLQG
jgi:rubredoxin